MRGILDKKTQRSVVGGRSLNASFFGYYCMRNSSTPEGHGARCLPLPACGRMFVGLYIRQNDLTNGTLRTRACDSNCSVCLPAAQNKTSTQHYKQQ
jgi:hypothetical protein